MDLTSPISECGGLLFGGAILALSTLSATSQSKASTRKRSITQESDEYASEFNRMYDRSVEGVGRGFALVPRIGNQYKLLREYCSKINIDVNDDNDEYAVLDMGFLLESNTFASERKLLRELWEVSGLLLGPGELFNDRPGLFRICIPHLSKDVLDLIVSKLEDFISGKKDKILNIDGVSAVESKTDEISRTPAENKQIETPTENKRRKTNR